MYKTLAPIVVFALVTLFSSTAFAADPIEGEWIKDSKSARIKLKVTRKGTLMGMITYVKDPKRLPLRQNLQRKNLAGKRQTHDARLHRRLPHRPHRNLDTLQINQQSALADSRTWLVFSLQFSDSTNCVETQFGLINLRDSPSG